MNIESIKGDLGPLTSHKIPQIKGPTTFPEAAKKSPPPC